MTQWDSPHQEPSPEPSQEPPQGSLFTQLTVVAIILIIAAIIAWVVNGVDLGFRIHNIMTGGVPHAAPGARPGAETGMQIGFWGTAAANALGLILNPIVLAGSIAMLRRRAYKLCMTAAVLAVIPFTGACCCLLELPLGIWALVVLTRPEVKAVFPQ